MKVIGIMKIITKSVEYIADIYEISKSRYNNKQRMVVGWLVGLIMLWSQQLT